MPEKKKPIISGRIPDGNVAWVENFYGRYFILAGEIKDDPLQPGKDVAIVLPRRFYPKMGPIISLANLTEAELDTLKELFDLAFELAKPIVQERDRVAQDEFDKGNDSFDRLYRRVPTLVVREGAKRENNPGLRQRHADLLDSSGGGEGVDGGVRRAGDGLAESDSNEVSTQNDESEDHES